MVYLPTEVLGARISTGRASPRMEAQEKARKVRVEEPLSPIKTPKRALES